MATKYTTWPQNIPNGHKIYQMATRYTKWVKYIPHTIYQHLPLQDLQKFTQIRFENMPSGNPATDAFQDNEDLDCRGKETLIRTTKNGNSSAQSVSLGPYFKPSKSLPR
jgi:hypothetical protein